VILVYEKLFSVVTPCCRCFPHVINLAVQAIYAALKDSKGLKGQNLLENANRTNQATLGGVALPQGVTRDAYLCALKTDVVGTA
jgi:hypothetical protein